MGNGLDTCDTALVFDNAALLCWKWLKMAQEFDKRFKYLENDVYIWEMAQVFEKPLNYVGNDVDLWEVSKIYGKWLKYLTNGLNMWELT